ncbi:LysR substrate-binding domain-containing protein [Amycolatopsis mongoliensis]|uniref:LysR substrate-binding domain-containing protein n=1 Tax=Amycolatopsis mongoliensis TaxID=715475 RepID=A0A9Y2JXL5_9PSEU|nr:LysR substrate-binding domain-containing protein [Amycolatopsis sp. 4-36]WIY06568.1 LysR substrate-binding domain-containing protein [Amycolatopsis sp. 4-36]
MLAARAAEILGRLDAADAELSAHVGLSAGRVRVASFSSVIGSLIPRAVAALTGRHPGLQIGLTDTEPPEALELLRTGKIDVAIIFRYDDTEPEPPDVRLHHLLDDPLYLLSTLRDATWIAAATGAASTCCRCAPRRGSNPGSATPPTTWSSCRRWSSPGWA